MRVGWIRDDQENRNSGAYKRRIGQKVVETGTRDEDHGPQGQLSYVKVLGDHTTFTGFTFRFDWFDNKVDSIAEAQIIYGEKE